MVPSSVFTGMLGNSFAASPLSLAARTTPTSCAEALELLKSNPDIRTNYVMAILQFLLLAPPETQPISQSYDPFLITFTEGMEKFAVGREFGHVIRNHKSPTIDIRLGEDSPSTNATPLMVQVLARSWQQELEADVGHIQRALGDHYAKHGCNKDS